MSPLHALLDQGAAFDPVYGHELANHLPMALIALDRLGASGDRLEAYAAHYAKRRRLRPARAAASWPAGEAWASRLGQPGAWPMYRDLFTQWLQHEPASVVLTQTLPALMPGCAAASFHGVIRTAYGLQANHIGEVAEGLAYWASTHQRLGEWPTSVVADTRDPVELLRELHAVDSRAGLIVTRMVDAARDGRVNQVAARLVIDDHTPQRLARAAAFAYIETGNFTALHLVTGCHAMRVIADAAPHIEATAALRWFWQAYAHGVVAAALRPKPAPEPWPWPRLIDAAIADEDEHVIKLVESCREHERAIGTPGDDLWRRAATRAIC